MTFAAPCTRALSNAVRKEDEAAHNWYRFVLAYPPHLVQNYLDKFEATPGDTVLDPFCGTGTTLVECKKRGIASIGIERNPVAHFASRTKTDWRIDAGQMVAHAETVASCARDLVRGAGTELRSLPDDQAKLLIKNSISAVPLHKSLILLDALKRHKVDAFYHHERLALAQELVTNVGNLHFGPEVGVRKIRSDAPVFDLWIDRVKVMARDLGELPKNNHAHSSVHLADSRHMEMLIEPQSIDAVITSPPYPNEKDYTRTTRLESVVLGFITGKDGLRETKKSLVRSNTRGVYKDDDDDSLVNGHEGILKIADQIERRRIMLGKTSGFERQYARVTKLYFGGMIRHLEGLRPLLRPGAQLAYVVGDQASYLRVMIRTGTILGELAESIGYELLSIDTFRKRLATASGQYLREEVVCLRWPGH